MARTRLLSFVRNHSLALLLIFLLASTGALLYFQYRQYQEIVDTRARPIPLQGDVSGPTTPGNQPSGAGETGISGGLTAMQGQDSPVSIRLSQGQAEPQAVEPRPVATGQPLSADEVAALLARLPKITPLPGDDQDFNLAQQPIPPPRTGRDGQAALPASPRSRSSPRR